MNLSSLISAIEVLLNSSILDHALHLRHMLIDNILDVLHLGTGMMRHLIQILGWLLQVNDWLLDWSLRRSIGASQLDNVVVNLLFTSSA